MLDFIRQVCRLAKGERRRVIAVHFEPGPDTIDLWFQHE